MDKLLCPSMMCADFSNLEREMQLLEEAGSDIFHIDIMDGKFVPNFGMGLQDTAFLCGRAHIPCDVHLMIEQPVQYVDTFADMGASILYVHPESETHPARTLQKIHDRGCKAGVAINPGTSAAFIEPLLYMADYVLVMSVNPGFAGQKYLSFVDEKIDRLLAWKEKYGYELVLDGACSPERIAALSAKGVRGFVLGTSALFGKGRSYGEIMKELREL